MFVDRKSTGDSNVMRTLAVGDIHGCFRSLDSLATFAAFTRSDRIITLGDYVDRGPDSRRVIEWLVDLP